ncbi:ATP-binding cassette domain-containing protein [candidate division GN15 bacterium]|nr:ATP-binding cassette domain-containing protein [candidate division GN15 bacterium]
MSETLRLSTKHLSIATPAKPLFSDLSFTLHAGEAIAVIGPNGCGKSSLLRHLTSIADSTGGVWCDANERDTDGLITDGGVHVAPNTLTVILSQVIVPWHVARSLMHDQDDGLVRRMAHEFGCDDCTREPEEMSAGELQKWTLIGLLSQQADLYLLDEPSNYLDLPGIVALEEQITRCTAAGSAFLIVTHDRELSDRVCDQTIYLSPQGIYQTPGGATKALAFEAADVASRRQQAADLRRKIKQLEDDCRTRLGWAKQKEKSKRGAGAAKGHISHLSAKMARRAKTAQKQADKQREKLESARPFVPKAIALSLPSRTIPMRTVFSLEEVSFSYYIYDLEVQPIFREVSLGATTRDKICLMGGNGAGKTTLLKLITGQLAPDSGTAYRNEAVRLTVIPQGLVGYFQHDCLLDNFRFSDIPEESVRQYLGAALLRGETVLRPLDQLSQGELMRAAIVHTILQQSDFFILDEPTSHLDLESIAVLESLLTSFSGGYLVVSHDRAFVSTIADRLFYVDAGGIRLA